MVQLPTQDGAKCLGRRTELPTCERRIFLLFVRLANAVYLSQALLGLPGKGRGGQGAELREALRGRGAELREALGLFFSSKAQGFGARALGFPAEWRGGLADLSSLEKPCVLFLCFFWQVRKSAFVFSARCVGPLEGKPPRYHQDEKARSFNPPSAPGAHREEEAEPEPLRRPLDSRERLPAWRSELEGRGGAENACSA